MGTPLYHFHHKSVQISEFVQISEAYSFICKVVINYSNRTYTTLIEHSTWSQSTLIEQSVMLFGFR